MGPSSPRKRGRILTLCDPKWIRACAGMTKLAVAPAQAVGPTLILTIVRAGLLEPPVREDLVDRAVGLHLAQRCVDLVEHRLIALAYGDPDAADEHRLVVLGEARFRISALRELVSDDR